VLDTNIAVSALLFPNGSLVWLRSAWQEKRFIPLVSHATATELMRVLAYPKFRLSAEEQEELLADYLPYCEVVVLPERYTAKQQASFAICRDVHDVPFLKLALAAKADALVSGDADLLAMKAQFSVPILLPAEARERV
jgi:putative PIN family toxin of toxin-antitoxin system